MSEAAEKLKERPLVQIIPARCKLAESVRSTHVITVEDASHPEDFLKPEFYSLVARDFVVGGHVEIVDDQMTFFGEYLVTACDSTWAKVHPLREIKLVASKEMPVHSDFSIEYKGTHRKFCVIRLRDKTIVHEGAQDRAAANLWLIGYAKTTGLKVAA